MKVITGDAPEYRTILSYGEGGSGKTDCVNHLVSDGKVIFIDLEKRREAILPNIRAGKIYCLEPENVSDVGEIFNRLRKALSGGEKVYDGVDYSEFKYLVIDSVSMLTKMALAEENPESTHGKRAYGKMATRVLDIFSYFADLPIHKYYTARVYKERARDEEGDPYVQIRIDAEGNKLKDGIGHDISVIVGMPKVEQVKDRCFLAGMTKEFPQVKDHSKTLSKREPFDLLALFKKSLGQTTGEE